MRTLTGRPLTVRGPVRRTGRTGVFHVRVRHLPEFFQVEVRGGKFGHRRLRNRVLRSIGWARRRGEVVNQASTIAAYNLTTQSPRQLRRHPEADDSPVHPANCPPPRPSSSPASVSPSGWPPGRPLRSTIPGGRSCRPNVAGSIKALKRWGTKASSRHAHRTFEPRRYRGNTPLDGTAKADTTNWV